MAHAIFAQPYRHSRIQVEMKKKYMYTYIRITDEIIRYIECVAYVWDVVTSNFSFYSFPFVIIPFIYAFKCLVMADDGLYNYIR